MVAALEQLLNLGALDNTGKLTPDGRIMAKLPLEPTYAKALLGASRTFDCAGEMLSLVAMLSTEGAAFLAPQGGQARDRADEARRRFTAPNADTITLVNVLGAFGSRRGTAAKQWCEKHFVNRTRAHPPYIATRHPALHTVSSPELTPTARDDNPTY